MKGITVVDVFREMGVNTEKSKTLAVGQMMQKWYADNYGSQPPKDNRPKTNGPGVHCFAIYPMRCRRRIMAFIAKVGAEQSRQMSLL